LAAKGLSFKIFNSELELESKFPEPASPLLVR
jgi:hypothetical protein